jgi:hypothetical protein
MIDGAGIPNAVAPWDSQLPDGVRWRYQKLARAWPAAATMFGAAVHEYLDL